MAAKNKGARKSAERPGKRAKKPVGRRSPKAAAPADGAGGEAMEELLDMDQAIELLKTSRPTFYRWLREGKIKGMKLGRQWRFYREDVERFLRGEEPRIELRADIGPLIGQLRARLDELGVEPEGLRDDNEVIQASGLMIWLASAMRASDLHIEPDMVEETGGHVARVRVRVDGVLHTVAEFDLRLLPAVVERWKTMANVDIRENRKPQDGRILVEFSGRQLDLRVNFLPACTGEAVTARLLDQAAVKLKLDRIDYAERDRETLVRNLESSWGTVLVTGPTGSGKTTVLYACLNHVSGPGVKTVTIEDPVEYFLPWAVQVQLRPQFGVSFAYAMRAALRADPDIILTGEIRDRETAHMVTQAALTGHLVLTTLHADEAARALVRMVEIGVDPFVVADSTRVVLAQRLVRKLCVECSAEAQISPNEVADAAELARGGGIDLDALPRTWRKAVGCPKCSQTGFRGRTVIAEVMEVTHEIGAALRKGATVDELRSIAVRQGMTTMAADGMRRASAGEVTLAEVIRALGLR